MWRLHKIHQPRRKSENLCDTVVTKIHRQLKWIIGMNGILGETEINNCIMSCKYTSTVNQYICIKYTSIGLRVSSQHHSSTAVFHSIYYIIHSTWLFHVCSKHISLWNNKGHLSKFRFFCFDFCTLSIYLIFEEMQLPQDECGFKIQLM